MASTLQHIILVQSSTATVNYNELVVFISEKGITQINERYILARTFSSILGLAYGVYHLLHQKDWLSFSDVQLSTVEHIFNNYWERVFSRSARFSFRLTAAFWVGYNILLSRFLVNMSMRLVSEEILYHAPQYGPRWYSLGLAIRLFSMSFSITAFAESIHLLCDHILTRKMNVTANSVDPNACLVSGLKSAGSDASPEALLSYHAFLELDQLAGHAPARRTEIFSDTTCVPSSWSQIASHCIKVLDKATDRINKASAGSSSKSSTASAQRLDTSVRRRLPPGKGGAFESNIFRPTKHDHFFDSLKGPSTEEILAKARIETDKSLADKESGKRPNLAGSRERPEILAFRWMKTNFENLLFNLPKLQAQLKTIPDAEILHAIEDFHLVAWSFQSLARLVMASYNEDQYGVVQKDIPKILESMLGLLMALESFLLTNGGKERFASNPYSAHVNAQALVKARSYAMLQALRTSIYQIVITFRKQLDEFTLASAYSDRLNHFIEYED
ncbi:Nucleoporin NDC1 [Mortierella polycephala]|uniref:Nucleoporin NDC1 n=1 Tax=Mortierella polycephala TaxID=41804 RepID=A0A9P6PMR0_9FUNG|nr:Nucleoporin NDC1 [Mortierella polycephala]